jgi:hemerythrin superfamily protein
MAKSQKQVRQEHAGGNGSGTQSRAKGAEAGTKQDAEQLLRADHRKVEELFRKFEGSGDESSAREEKKQLTAEICKELVIHSRLEEEIFYPACRQKGVEDDLLDEAQVEHDSLKLLIGDLLDREPGSSYYDAKVKVLSEYVKHHVTEEEKAASGIFAKARAGGVDMDALGERLQQRKEQLMQEMLDGVPEAPRPRSFSVRMGGFNRNMQEQETGMARPYERDRDEDRYRQEDDRGMFGSRYGRERDEESGGRYGRRGGYPEGSRSGTGGGWSGYQQGRNRNSQQSYWDERDPAGGYYGGSTPGSSRQGGSGSSGGGFSSGRYSGGSGYSGGGGYWGGGSESGPGYRGERSGYGGAGSSESGYGSGSMENDDYFSGSRGYTGNAYSGGRDENDWSTRGIGGTREGYGRSGSGSFERERNDYARNVGNQDRGRIGGRNRSEDDESYTRGGGQARFGNRSGNYTSNDEYPDNRERSSRSENEGRGGRSGSQGGWRNRD